MKNLLKTIVKPKCFQKKSFILIFSAKIEQPIEKLKCFPLLFLRLLRSINLSKHILRNKNLSTKIFYGRSKEITIQDGHVKTVQQESMGEIKPVSMCWMRQDITKIAGAIIVWKVSATRSQVHNQMWSLRLKRIH